MPVLTGAIAVPPPDLLFPFELSLEEVFTNVATHGAARGGRTPSVDVRVSSDGRRVTLVVADDAPAFDPLRLPPADTTASLEDRSVGGLGVFLVRRMMDEVRYERVGGRNRIVMTKTID